MQLGSAGRKGYHTPRISLSFAFAEDNYEPAYLSRDCLPFPSLQQRFALSCAQMMVYHERFGFSSKQLGFFHAVFTLQKAVFNPAYAKQVLVEFVSAAKESTAQTKHQGKGEEKDGRPGPASVPFDVKSLPNDATDEDEEELMDKALEAMLDAQMDGYDGFEDDFDNLQGFHCSEDEEEDEE